MNRRTLEISDVVKQALNNAEIDYEEENNCNSDEFIIDDDVRIIVMDED